MFESERQSGEGREKEERSCLLLDVGATPVREREGVREREREGRETEGKEGKVIIVALFSHYRYGCCSARI